MANTVYDKDTDEYTPHKDAGDGASSGSGAAGRDDLRGLEEGLAGSRFDRDASKFNEQAGDTPKNTDSPERLQSAEDQGAPTPFTFKGKGNQKVGGKENAGGFLSRHKKAVGLSAGVGGSVLFMLVMFMFVTLFLGPFKTVHFATVLRSVGFARFTYVMNKRFALTMFDAAVLTDRSTGNFRLEKTSLIYKVAGVNPERQLKQLGREGTLKFDFTGTKRFGGVLPQVNSFNGVVIDGKSIMLDDLAKNSFGKTYDNLTFREAMTIRAQFTDAVKSGLADRLALGSRSYRWGVYKGIRQATGIRMVKWANKAREYLGKSPTEARKLNVQETTNRVLGPAESRPKSAFSDINEDADAAREEAIKAAEEGRSPGEVRSKVAARMKIVSNVSGVVFVLTAGCIVHDLANSFEAAQEDREKRVARMGAEPLTTAAQVKTGETRGEAVGAESGMWDGAEDSVLYRQSTGQRLTPKQQAQIPSLPGVSKPVSGFAEAITAIDSVLFSGGPLGDVRSSIADASCSVVLNQYVQYGVAGGELIFAIVSAGQTEGVIQAIKAGISGGLQIAGSIALGDMLGQLLDKSIKSYANLDFSGLEKGEDRYNNAAIGVDYLQQSGSRQINYGRPLSPEETNALQKVAMDDLYQQNREKSFSERYFALDNPFSVASLTLARTPSSLNGIGMSVRQGLGSVASTIASPQRLLSSFSNLLMPAGRASAEEPMVLPTAVGVDQWGWSTKELASLERDPAFSLPNIVISIEPRLAELTQRYEKCYSYVKQSDKPEGDECSQARLSEPDALMWRAYMSESYAADRLAGAL